MGVEDVDLVHQNEEGARGGRPIRTTLFQSVLEHPERSPDICGRALSSIRNDFLIEVISL
jgi:hypothetical protein